MRGWLVIASASAWLSAAWAQAPEVAPSPEEKYADYTPRQIAELPETERLNEVPIRYIFAAQGYDDPEGFQLVHSMKLQALMYPAVASFERAVKAFQRDLGKPASGSLTVSQIAELTYRNGVVKLGRAELPNTVLVVTLYEQYATAQGSWAGTDTKLAQPINQVSIHCDRGRGVCEETTTSVVVPGRDSWDMNFLILTSTNRYEVTDWDRARIQATRLINCRHVDLLIDSDREVTRTQGEPATIGENCAANLSSGDPAAQLPPPAHLIDGGEVIRARYRELRQLALSFMSSDFRAKLDAWRSHAPGAKSPP